MTAISEMEKVITFDERLVFLSYNVHYRSKVKINKYAN